MNWKGEKAKYPQKHAWIRKHWGSANKCESLDCKGKSNTFDWANLSGEYLRIREDWKMLCRSCHAKLDGHCFQFKNKCKRGHDINDNPYIAPDGQRECRKCKKLRARKWHLKKKNIN